MADPGAACCQSVTSWQVTASPAKKLQRSEGRAPSAMRPVRRIRLITLGVENQTVMPCSATKPGRSR